MKGMRRFGRTGVCGGLVEEPHAVGAEEHLEVGEGQRPALQALGERAHAVLYERVGGSGRWVRPALAHRVSDVVWFDWTMGMDPRLLAHLAPQEHLERAEGALANGGVHVPG